MVAFVWCYKIGDYIDQQIQKIKIKKHGRRAVRVFKYGIDYLSKLLKNGFNLLKINLLIFFHSHLNFVLCDKNTYLFKYFFKIL